MGWYHGFKLHLLCNDSGEVITFKLKEANVDDRDSWMWKVFTKELFGKVFADRGYIKQKLFECLFDKNTMGYVLASFGLSSAQIAYRE